MLFAPRATGQSECYPETKCGSANGYLYPTLGPSLTPYSNTHRISPAFMAQRYSSAHYPKLPPSDSSPASSQVDEDIGYQDAPETSPAPEEGSTSADVSDYYRAVEPVAEAVSFSRLRELSEFLSTTPTPTGRFPKAPVTAKKTMPRERSPAKRRDNFNPEILFNHPEPQSMSDHPEPSTSKGKGRKRRSLLPTQPSVQDSQDEDSNQATNTGFFWNPAEGEGQNIRTGEDFLNLVQDNPSIVLDEHSTLVQDRDALETQLKDMEQSTSILNHQYQVGDAKMRAAIDEAHERSIQQVLKIANLEDEIKGLLRKTSKVPPQLQDLDEYIASRRPVEPPQVHITSPSVLAQRPKADPKARLYDWQNDPAPQSTAQPPKRTQLDEPYPSRHS